MSDNDAPLTVQEIAEIAGRHKLMMDLLVSLRATSTGIISWALGRAFAGRELHWVMRAEEAQNLLRQVDELEPAGPADLRRLLAELQRAHDERDALAGQLAAAMAEEQCVSQKFGVIEECPALMEPESWCLYCKLRAALAGADTLRAGGVCRVTRHVKKQGCHATPRAT